MKLSLARILAVTLFAAGSFTHMSMSAAAPANAKAHALALGGPASPQTPIPICATCGRGGNPN